MTSKTGSGTKHHQMTACVQSGIHMKTSQAHACCQDKESEGAVQQLLQYHLLECCIEILRLDDLTSSFMFELVEISQLPLMRYCLCSVRKG
jgi:hypothetical protein